MAQNASDVDGLLQICKSMISCSDCKEIGFSELTCGHIACDSCYQFHKCSASCSTSITKSNSPSFSFLKGLFEQLTRISSAGLISNNYQRMDDAGNNIPRKRHRRLPVTKRSCSCEDHFEKNENSILPPKSGGVKVLLPKKNGIKTSLSKKDEIKTLSSKLLTHHELSNITIKVENEIDAYIERYRPVETFENTDDKHLEDNNSSKNLNADEMPKLERQDKFKRNSHISVASSSGPDVLEAFDKIENCLNGIGRTKKKKLNYFKLPETSSEVISSNEENTNNNICEDLDEFYLTSETKNSLPNIPNDSNTDRTIIHNGDDLHISGNVSARRIISNGSSQSVQNHRIKSEHSKPPPSGEVHKSISKAGPSYVRKKQEDKRRKKVPTRQANSLTSKNNLNPAKKVNGQPMYGFHDFEILSCAMKTILCRMAREKSSCGVGNFGDYEVIVKRKISRNGQESESLLSPQMRISRVQNVSQTLWKSPINDSMISCFASEVKIEEEEDISFDPLSSRLSESEIVNNHETSQHFQHSESEDMAIDWVAHNFERHRCPSSVLRKTEKIIRSSAEKSPSQTNLSCSNDPNVNGKIESLKDEICDLICIEKDNQIGDRDPLLVSLATCNLSLQEGIFAIKLAKATKSQLRNSFSHETTHLILSQQNKENSIGSQDYLLAIAHGAFIVNFDWVEECLRQNKILSPYGFIPKTEEGPCRCLETINKPFSGFYFFMGPAISPSSHLDYVTFQVTKTLCLKGGACIVMDHEKFLPFVDRENIYPRFYICTFDSLLPDFIKAICEKIKAVALKKAWIVDSIKQYRALPILDYLYENIEVKDLQEQYKIPPLLVSKSVK